MKYLVLALVLSLSVNAINFNGLWASSPQMFPRLMKITQQYSSLTATFVNGSYANQISFNVTIIGDGTYGFGTGQLFQGGPTNIVPVFLRLISEGAFQLFWTPSDPDFQGGIYSYTLFPTQWN